ncbi:type II toxin-antitoxin system PemK/MazF family toxin [Paraburkholderia sp. D15]|uniref:type II toxin-antitoxin system PemK/MazF family toxin n=1 Tax=Paraburkholderia sp. D15 TaxID=2880218 RepID=UPI00247A3C4E|nr:type II toxin-antitoxin system PemK/MazF family toxin [Paraburkholderia sp. D15]WGS50157.1 type II toxin-antitoxin system PemK/MazF family toxin [Paraburkholderia sp. D15]
MPQINVEYFELVDDPVGNGNRTPQLRGRESFEDIEEALIPSSETFKVFCVKKFAGTNNYRWHVESVVCTSAPGDPTASYKVELSELNQRVPEVYLEQTLRNTGAAVNRVLWTGTLVEVDYGFIQSVGGHDGVVRTNERYSDTLQQGEMHKRRLAVVVNVSGGRVKVAPVTSNPQAGQDKTCFELDPTTLSKLSFYGSSGKQSWVLCSMLETVSVSRILPPMSKFLVRGRERDGRNVHYTQKLNANELKLLESALLHAIGITDYSSLKDELSAKKLECAEIDELRQSVENLKAQLATAGTENARLKLIEEIARDWDRAIGGGTLDARVTELAHLYREMAEEAD